MVTKCLKDEGKEGLLADADDIEDYFLGLDVIQMEVTSSYNVVSLTIHQDPPITDDAIHDGNDPPPSGVNQPSSD